MERGRRSFPTATGWFFAKPRKDPRRPHPSRRAHAPSTLRSRRSTRAPQDEDKLAELRLVAEPLGEFPISRCQTAHLVPATHFCVRVLHRCFTHPEPRGGRSAEKRSGACEAPVRRAIARQRRALTRLRRGTPGASQGALRPSAC